MEPGEPIILLSESSENVQLAMVTNDATFGMIMIVLIPMLQTGCHTRR